MKIALIAPHSLSGQTYKTDYQLALPQEFTRDNTDYQRTYKKHCDDPKQFVILDNGAAEGKTIDTDYLMHIAARRRVSELVIPDVLGDADATIASAQKFERAFVPSRPLPPPAFGLMFVAQGQTFAEVTGTIEWAHKQDWITTIGIPRHMIKTLNDKYARVQLATWILSRKSFQAKPMHFLGASELFHDEVVFLAAMSNNPTSHGLLRGMDTSMPFNYAYNGIALNDDDPKPTKRPSSYFDLPEECFNAELLRENIAFFVKHHDGA